MTTKVLNTVSHTNSQKENIIVAKGRLVFRIMDLLPEIGMLGSNNVHPLFLWTQNHKNNFKELVEYHSTLSVCPAIISETEKVSIGELSYNKITGAIETIPETYCYDDDLYYKLLATYNQLTSKHLQIIIDGKLKDGDIVYVECENVYNETIIKIKNNFVILYKNEKSWQSIYNDFHKNTDNMDNAVEFLQFLMARYNAPSDLITK